MKILLTTTSFQDTPGAHHDLLKKTGWEVITGRGPLNEADTLALVGEVDGYICGDDAITRKVLEKARPKLKVLSKYGIGVDKIDVKSGKEVAIRARAFGMKVLAYDNYFDEAFSRQHEVKRVGSLDEVFAVSDYISL